jgi:outer membrane protein
MKRIFLTLLFLIFLAQKAFSITISEALLEAYKNNPELNAERENIEVSKEDLKISKSEFLPTVTLSGSRSEENTKKLTSRDGTNSTGDVSPETQSIIIEQKLFQGFAGLASVQKNKIGLNLAQANLLKTEQQILYKTIEAYSGLVLANKKFDINKKNVDLFERLVETSRARLERDQITLSDVAQAEASLAEAKAEFINSKNEVTTTKLIYEKVIGPISDTQSLDNDLNIDLKIPESLIEAIEISKKNNPELIIAKLEYEQSEKDIKIARADLSPSATLSLESSKTDDLSSTIDERDKETVMATLSWPIFKGGKNTASLNKSKNLKNRKKLLLDHAARSNDTSVSSSWSNLKSSMSFLESVKLQVKAAEIANEGITLEYETGLGRSTLDVMQSNSILLKSKISLASSQRNFILSKFKLLQSVGILNNKYLKLQ